MLPHGIQVHVLTLAEIFALLIANRLTPDWLRQELIGTGKRIKERLPSEDKSSVEAAEAKAVLRAAAYSRMED